MTTPPSQGVHPTFLTQVFILVHLETQKIRLRKFRVSEESDGLMNVHFLFLTIRNEEDDYTIVARSTSHLPGTSLHPRPFRNAKNTITEVSRFRRIGRIL